MRSALYLIAAAAVALSAFWAYRVNYEAQAALARAAELRERIAAEREALTVLRAEWAWLNAPERLRRLAEAHDPELGLRPMAAARFGDLAALPAPPPERFWARIDPAELAPAAEKQ